MTVLTFVFISSPGIFLIANPKPRQRSWMAEANNTEPNKFYLDSRSWMQSINQTTDKLQDWAYGTGERLKIASFSTLALGSVGIVMLIRLGGKNCRQVSEKENEAVDKDKEEKKENKEDKERKTKKIKSTRGKRKTRRKKRTK